MVEYKTVVLNCNIKYFTVLFTVFFIIKIICILFSTIGALFLKIIDVKFLQKVNSYKQVINSKQILFITNKKAP